MRRAAEGAASVVIADRREDRLQIAAALGIPAAGSFGEDAIDVAVLCAGGEGAIRFAFDSVRPGGTVVALGLSGKETVPFDFDGMVVRDIDLIGVLGSVGYWAGRGPDRDRPGQDRAARHPPLSARTHPRRARAAHCPGRAQGRHRAPNLKGQTP